MKASDKKLGKESLKEQTNKHPSLQEKKKGTTNEPINHKNKQQNDN